MIYVYDNVCILKEHDNGHSDFHIATTDQKWNDMLHNEDLRFFKHKKNVLNELLKNPSVILKVGSWNSPALLKDFEKSRKFRHPNLMKYICYFEYEMDIIHYLCNDDVYPEDAMEELSIIIKPFFEPIVGIEMQNQPCLILKQILLSVFVLFFKHNTVFYNISFENIFIKRYKYRKTILYDIGNTCFTIKTKDVIKIDEFRNMITCNYIENINKRYEILNSCVKHILYQFHKTSAIQFYNTHSEIIDKESSVKMLNKIIREIDNCI
jgi:hypothetical protein